MTLIRVGPATAYVSCLAELAARVEKGMCVSACFDGVRQSGSSQFSISITERNNSDSNSRQRPWPGWTPAFGQAVTDEMNRQLVSFCEVCAQKLVDET